MPASRQRDDGFTVVEVLVSITIMSMVMLALSSSFIVTVRFTRQQGDKQTAMQAADDAMERARAIQVSSLISGRDQQGTNDQLQAAAAGVPNISSVLNGQTADNVTVPYDTTANVGDGANAAVPTVARTLSIGGAAYRQYWFIELCYRDTSDPQVQCKAGTSGSAVMFYRVIVAVTWTDRLCANQLCSYITTSLIGKNTVEPVFDNSGDVPAAPKITTDVSTARTGDVYLPVSVQMAATGGGGALTWTASGLPDGLLINASTGVISGIPTTNKSYTAVKVTVTDDYKQYHFVTFTWTIYKQLTFGNPGTLSSTGGVAYSKTFTASNGLTPYTWAATGLPGGLTMDPSSGTVSGTPTTVGSQQAAITVTDKNGQTAAQTFTWNVPALSVTTSSVTSTLNTAANYQLVAAGGIQPYVRWALASGLLPPGLSLNTATGVVSGTPITKGTYTPTFVVTDTSGATASRAVTWKVP
ncbi:putative Ig domain-containing protein [Actinoplanes sp. NPDC051513]|uniref:putative Ig domain-containing protein n=1 Tax=Actinoplanes sp. NPDC051513 TaxID=3363908 RepID=UPI0037AD447F